MNTANRYFRYILPLLVLAFLCFATSISSAGTEDTPSLSADVSDGVHSEPVIINTDTGTAVTVSGDVLDTESVTGLTSDDISNLSKEELTERLTEEGIYSVTDSDAESIHVSFPFANRRIIVFTDEGNMQDTFGASEVSYFEPGHDYILDYKTEEDAAKAYESLISVYGKEGVMPDLPISIQSKPFSNTNALSNSWGIDMMGLDSARDRANEEMPQGKTVTVAVLDSGIYPEHELFSGRLSQNGESFVSESPYNSDITGHGTHVAGIIADGTSEHVMILPIKVLNDEGRGGFAEVINGIYYAVENNADVINMSLAINLEEYGNYWSITAVEREEAALKHANKEGCICIAAAGNDSKNLDVLKVYPAISESTITVSSVNESRQRASSSNYGVSVDFAAPGDMISSAATNGRDMYCTKSGTSIDAPDLSAACAMIRLYNEDADNETTINVLKELSVDLGDVGKDKKYGYGLVVFRDGIIPNAEEILSDSDGSAETEEASSPSSENSSVTSTTNHAAAPAQSSIQIKSASISVTASNTYTGRALIPAVKVIYGGKTLRKGTDYTISASNNTSVGTGKLTIRGKGRYAGTVTRTFKIIPKGTNLSKAKAAKKSAKISWKSQKTRMAKQRVTGYQIQYSASPSFASNAKTVTVKGYSKTSKKIAKLKSKKKYYFRVRAYAKVGSGTYYSAWSPAKSVKVK